MSLPSTLKTAKLTILSPQDGEKFRGGRQEAGFIVEEKIRTDLGLLESRTLPNGSTQKIGGNAQWDAFSPAGMGVSIKAPKAAVRRLGVPLSGWHRHREVDEDFYFIVAPRPASDPYGYADLRVFQVDHREWLKHFPEEYVAKIAELFDGVEGTYDYDPIWKKRRIAFTAEWNRLRKEKGYAVALNPKRGHDRTGAGKFQLRMQCGVLLDDLTRMGAVEIKPEEIS